MATEAFGVYSDFFFFKGEEGIRDLTVTGVQTCALPISDLPRESARGELVDDAFPGGGFGLRSPVDDEQALLELAERALEAPVAARVRPAEGVAELERGLGAVTEEFAGDGVGVSGDTPLAVEPFVLVRRAMVPFQPVKAGEKLKREERLPAAEVAAGVSQAPPRQLVLPAPEPLGVFVPTRNQIKVAGRATFHRRPQARQAKALDGKQQTKPDAVNEPGSLGDGANHRSRDW